MKMFSGIFFKSLVMAGMRILASACALVLSWIIGRHSVHELGVFRTLFVYFGICEALPLLGMQTYLVREISIHPEKIKSHCLHALVFALGIAVLGVITLMLLGSFGSYSPALRKGLYIVAASFPAMSASLVCVSVLVGTGQAEKFGLIQGIETLVRTGLGIACILSGWGVLSAITAMVVTRWLVLGGYWIFIKPHLSGGSWNWDRGFFREFTGEVPTFSGITIMALMGRFTPQLVLPWMMNDAAAGQFAAAFVFIDMVLLVPTAIVTNLGPVLARRAKVSKEASLESARQGIKVLILGVAPFATLIAALAGPLFAHIFPGNAAYAASAHVLSIIIWSSCLQVIDVIISITLVSNQAQSTDLQCLTVGGVVLLALLAIGVPWLGLTGAAAAIVLSLTIQLIYRVTRVSRLLGPLNLPTLVWKPLLASAAAGSVALLLANWHWLVAGCVGALVYLIALAALNAFNLKERQAIGSFLHTGNA